jgi:predicted DNA-binding transcriptional regulator AlpA
MTKLPRIYSYRELSAMGYGDRVTIWRRVQEGTFPRPIDMSHGRKGWPENLLLSWLEARGVASNALGEPFRQVGES